jgi:hypothetical protein
MFRIILWSQWRESRIAVLLLSAVALVLPTWSLWGAGTGPWAAWDLLSASQSSSMAYPLLALVAALALAFGAWRPDHRTRHIYALTLPVSRSRYLMLRYTAGMVLLSVIGVALAIGTGGATVWRTLPAHLYAHPFGIALRFILAGFAAYTLVFAIRGVTARTARLIASLLLVLVAVSLLTELLGFDWNPLVHAFDAMLGRYGPLAPFRTTWMLIDV